MTGDPRATQGYVDSRDVSLRDYFESRLETLEKSLDARFLAQEKAVRVANEAAEKRLDGMNEFRSTLTDQSKTFATRIEFNAFKERAETDIKSLNITRAELAGKATQSQVLLAIVFSAIGAALGIISLLIKAMP